jgi:ketosteroid isomerase-like protein
MSEQNVDTMRRLLAALTRRDTDAMLELWDPEAEFMPIMAALEGTVYRGREGLKMWLDEMEDHWEFFEAHPQEFLDLGDRVLALGHWNARGRASGVEMREQPASWVAQVQDRRIVFWRTYTDRDEALQAVGLAE